jgi:hypothetical protein
MCHTPVKQKADTSRSQHSLLHWETLLVTPTHDLKDIALEFLQNKGMLHMHTFEH